MTDQSNPTLVSETSEKTQTMTNEYRTLKSLTVGSYTAKWEENPAGTSQRISLYNENAQWASEQDYSANEWASKYPTLNALGKFFSGMAQGSGKLIVTAPPAKAQWEAPTGAYGYVRWDYNSPDDAIEITDENGNLQYVDVPQRSVPSAFVGSFRRLKLAPTGGFYVDPQSGYITPEGEIDPKTGMVKTVSKTINKKVNGVIRQVDIEDEDDYHYWYVAALSMLLEGRNITISVNTQKLRIEAERVWSILENSKVEDIKKAHDLYRLQNRVTSRGQKEMDEAASITREELPDLQPQVGAMIVPLEMGGDFDLATVEIGGLVEIVDDTGFPMSPRTVKDEHSRLSLYKWLLDNNFAVRLSC